MNAPMVGGIIGLAFCGAVWLAIGVVPWLTALASVVVIVGGFAWERTR